MYLYNSSGLLVIPTMYEKYEIENYEKLRNNEFLNHNNDDNEENEYRQNA